MAYTSAQRKGHRAELEVLHQLQNDGFTVIKAGGSKGLFDLVAWTAEKLYFIQVKSGTPCSKAEEKRILACPIPPAGKRYVVTKRDRVGLEWKVIV